MITKTCYFYNIGIKFNKDDMEYLKNVWNCNPNCCKSDLCNGLSCEEYGIDFNEKFITNYVKDYVKKGHLDTYGYIKSVDITLPESDWNDLYKDLVENYQFDSIDDASKNGFISYDYGDLLEDNSSYWEEPDKSYLKTGFNTIEENKIHILKENQLNKKTMNWINQNLYGNILKEDMAIGL